MTTEIYLVTFSVIFLLALIPLFSLWKPFSKKVKEGDRVRMGGGYDIPPEWLGGRPYVEGTVVKFMENPWKSAQNERDLVAIVKLDEKITFRHLSGDFLALSLRFKGASWKGGDVVHIELFDGMPNRVGTQEHWIESHASFSRIG